MYHSLQVQVLHKALAEAIAPAVADPPDYEPLYAFLKAPNALTPPVTQGDGYTHVGQSDLARLAVACADHPQWQEGDTWPNAEGLVDGLLEHGWNVSKTFGLT